LSKPAEQAALNRADGREMGRWRALKPGEGGHAGMISSPSPGVTAQLRA